MSESDFELDHIGWDLMRAAWAWKDAFTAGMVARGHSWFAEARGNLIHLIGPQGAKQGLLVARSGLSKQAVQQLLDELEQDGIVRREIDPDDARGRRVVFTSKGRRALHDAQEIKIDIEKRYSKLLGKNGLGELKSLLDKVAKADQGKA